jgi:hypothetical protein
MSESRFGGYHFIELIMYEESLPHNERKRFYDLVAYRYIMEKEFRDLVHGKTLLFADGKMIGIFEDEDYAIRYPCPSKITGKQCSKTTFYLGDDQVPFNQF